MNKILSDLIGKCVYVYIDDILFFSKGQAEHIRHLQLVFDKLMSAGLKLKPTKCSFGLPEVKLLGYVLNKDGIKADPDKVAAIVNLKPPTTVKEVRSLLGTCNYYRSSLEGFATICEPIVALTRRNVRFKWNDETQSAFEQLKALLTSSHVMAPPDLNKEYKLYTDACDYAVGGILVQDSEDGIEKVIQYVSHTLSTSQRLWPTIQKEAFGVVYCIHDLSAAFDTIDHSTLLERLYGDFGISGTVFQWFKSYISNRQQRVHIDGSLSCTQDLRFGVPQGSVLGPFLFCLYTTSISQIITTHDVSHHMYADDTQVYLELSQSDTHKSISSLSDCLTDISLWMKSSKLKLNSDKTEFIIIGTKQQRQKLSNHFPVKLLDNDISPSDSVRNLGVIFDSDFSFHKHVSNICKSCFYHIRDLRRIRRHIPLSTAKTISNALISSRLDYCNSLINNIAKQDLSKLQRVQNCLARVILRAPRFSPSLPLLKQLHWLPVNYRIKFKLCTLTFRALAIHQPPYLASLLHFSNIPRQLRSSTSKQLSIPRTKLNLGKRAFSVAAPIIWNELPTTLKSCESLASFRKNLKTYLFKIAFPP